MSDSVSLKEHFEKILAEKDRAINTALAAAKEAVGVAEKNAEKWRDNANEWRGAMTDREVRFMPREEALLAAKNLEDKIRVIEQRQDFTKGRSDGANWLWGILAGAGGLLIGVIGAAIAFHHG
jgi:hypothetical protein